MAKAASQQAGSSVTVTKQGEESGGVAKDDDRMDVLPEQRSYQPGDTARLQVTRCRSANATALLTVEREGILHSEVLQLNSKDPTGGTENPARMGSERLCERAGLARPPARRALVQLLHLGLGRPRVNGGAPSGTMARNTWRRHRWWT